MEYKEEEPLQSLAKESNKDISLIFVPVLW